MKTNELAHLMVELSHFDIKFKDSDVHVSWDPIYDIALTITVPTGSAPPDPDYIDRLKFFLRRRIDEKHWYITNQAIGPTSIIIRL